MYNDHLTDYIEGHFKDCLKPGISFQPEYHPHIPEKHMAKAKKHFLSTEEGETVLMLFDTSLFGKGKNGLALTDQAVYFRDMFGGTMRVKYRDWRADRDETEKLLKISPENAFILSPFLDRLLTEICTMKTYDGLFEQERKCREEAEAEAKKAEAAASRGKDEDDDEDEDDDDESGAELAMNFLGIVMDVASDPTYE